jgi:hypothetical protein
VSFKQALVRVALAATCLSGSTPVLGSIPNLTWGQVEQVDSPVPAPSSPSGLSVFYFSGRWHVVYVKSAEVYDCSRGPAGWSTPTLLSSSAGTAKAPHLSRGGTSIHAVWEDSRTGHPEVYTRRYNGSSWSTETCLTCDATASRTPVMAGDSYEGYVAWEEGSVGSSGIRGKRFQYDGWGITEVVSTGTGSASEPTIDFEPALFGAFIIAWADTRLGGSQIYTRTRDDSGWWSPTDTQLTDLAGFCRRPSIQMQMCCGDVIGLEIFTVFECDQTGGVEVYGTCGTDLGQTYTRLLSVADTLASERPNLDSFVFSADMCGMGGGFPRYYCTWSDRLPSGLSAHLLREHGSCYSSGHDDLFSTAGASHSAVGVTSGTPQARVMVVWVETASGQTALLSREGRLPGCYEVDLDLPPAILLAPEGIPGDSVRVIDSCTGNPVSQHSAGLLFDATLNAALTWDPQQPHPAIPEQSTDAQGRVVFHLRGGGCSEAGQVRAICQGYTLDSYVFGAKSPDVDGNCVVEPSDLAYVLTQLGTDDFCADLDGTSWVDSADVAIVQATLGDLCSHLVGVDPAAGPSREPLLSVFPNPCRTSATFRITGAAGRAPDVRPVLRLSVMDVGGRRVREMEAEGQADPTWLHWDTRNDAGQPVPSGLYLAVLRRGEQVWQRPVLVVR